MAVRLAGIFGIGLLLAGCGNDSERPPQKPSELEVAVLQSDAGAPDKKVLSKGRISTKSGEILILEPDGSVSEVNLETDAGQEAFALSEADIALLNKNLGLDLSGVPDMGPVRSRGMTAQEKALAAFRARTKPLRLNLPASFEAEPTDFQGASVTAWPSKRKSGESLVEVTANLRSGVDADTAFAYATCALANWADAKGTPYARHIRTLRDKRNGKMIVGSVFTLSEKRPMGLTVMTTKDTLQECKSRGIPAA
ncbi:hypothetical protein [Paracoccus ravus]|uniref:hypothetical protein n=1 Tax=Paracoccus ravus TaxID=2447760 RepID=UPI00106F044E|nr:hypothetical protein [Paracoccus ravus]